MTNKPNIVLLMCDQWRGDCLGIDGHPDVKTPFIDTLAATGAMFRNAYTACPSCIPARAALLTGLGQKRHGRVGYRDGLRWDYAHTLPGELAGAGYYTQCVGKMHVHPLRSLMGFHNVELHDGALQYYRSPDIEYCQNQKTADDYYHWLQSEKGAGCDVNDTGLECNSWAARPWMYEEKYHPTNWVTARSIDFLRRRDRGRPFFLMASYVRPHPPFDAPSCYFDMYRGKDLRPPAVGGWADRDALAENGRVYDAYTGPEDPALVREAQAGYYACITHLDHQIGRLIQALKEDRVWENTLVLFTSDHGELLCDHHLFRKSRPYQGSVRIPLIISGGAAADLRGARPDALAELRDILPTLLDFAGAETSYQPDGVSLLPAAQEQGDTRAYLHGEHSCGEQSNHYIVTKTDKYVWYSQCGREQYFDLANDPHELRDRIADPDCVGRVTYLRDKLIEELNGREEGYTDGRRLIIGRPPQTVLGHELYPITPPSS